MRPSEGIARIDAAIQHGRRSIEAAASMFSGTVPPKPWPSPELYQAIDEANDTRDRLEVFVRHGDPDFNANTPQVARVVAEVQRRIDNVETAARALDERRGVVATRMPAALVAKAKAVATSPKIVPWLLLGYLAWKGTKVPRRR